MSTSTSLWGVGVREKGEGEFISHVHGRSQMMKQNYKAFTVETNMGTRKEEGQSLGKLGGWGRSDRVRAQALGNPGKRVDGGQGYSTIASLRKAKGLDSLEESLLFFSTRRYMEA